MLWVVNASHCPLQASADVFLQMVIPEELDERVAFLAALEKRTDPSRPQRSEPSSMKMAPSTKNIRVRLNSAKASLAEVNIVQE